MTIDDLAQRLSLTYQNGFGDPIPWHGTSDAYRARWRRTAQAAADAVGVTLDKDPDPRYAAAFGILFRGGLSAGTADTEARAIVAALDATPEEESR